MENKKPDNIVYTVEAGYNANVLPYATGVGAPVIRVDDVVSWKSRGIDNVNKELGNKFNELKLLVHDKKHISLKTNKITDNKLV